MDYLLLILAGIRIDAEENLVNSLRLKDPQALEQLYDFYGTPVYRLVFRIIGDPGISEEIVQETFARLWEGAAHLSESATQIGPLIFTIARNRALDHVRSRSTHLQNQRGVLDTFEHYVSQSTVEESMITEENLHRIASAVRALNNDQKQVITLAYYEGLSQTQIAERMQRPLGTIKSWTRSALSVLRSSLQLEEAYESHA